MDEMKSQVAKANEDIFTGLPQQMDLSSQIHRDLMARLELAASLKANSPISNNLSALNMLRYLSAFQTGTSPLLLPNMGLLQPAALRAFQLQLQAAPPAVRLQLLKSLLSSSISLPHLMPPLALPLPPTTAPIAPLPHTPFVPNPLLFQQRSSPEKPDSALPNSPMSSSSLISPQGLNSSNTFLPNSPTKILVDRLTPDCLNKSGFSSSSSAENTPEKSETVGYTIDAFLVSDGRSKTKHRRNSIEQGNIFNAKHTCSKCGKGYATSSNLSRHKQTHRSLDSNQAKACPHCNKVYVSMPALSMHILTHDLKHKCPICGKSFSRSWLLQGHLRSHTGEKPYGCAHCGKAFADRSNLRAHMQTHSAVKQFVCNKCHKSFALKSYLNKHLESSCIKE